jgi:predicted anti-sigma-YlaC factor YlaD
MLEGFGGNHDGSDTVMPPHLIKERLQNKKPVRNLTKLMAVQYNGWMTHETPRKYIQQTYVKRNNPR